MMLFHRASADDTSGLGTSIGHHRGLGPPGFVVLRNDTTLYKRETNYNVLKKRNVYVVRVPVVVLHGFRYSAHDASL
ncbi:hypothetical protein NPIL_361071 [Nephila pilipes]|uniref:Uncharacterized protein n=1 Tax=Nephila pilipes TaxID=299642 RepID=A0A8X6NT35_NEPPI|nr:hypothetical protein NPIL_361071 [Nephila pilipes]